MGHKNNKCLCNVYHVFWERTICDDRAVVDKLKCSIVFLNLYLKYSCFTCFKRRFFLCLDTFFIFPRDVTPSYFIYEEYAPSANQERGFEIRNLRDLISSEARFFLVFLLLVLYLTQLNIPNKNFWLNLLDNIGDGHRDNSTSDKPTSSPTLQQVT